MSGLFQSIEHGFEIMRLEEDDYVGIKIYADMSDSDLMTLTEQLRDAWPGLRVAVFVGDIEVTRITP